MNDTFNARIDATIFVPDESLLCVVLEADEDAYHLPRRYIATDQTLDEAAREFMQETFPGITSACEQSLTVSDESSIAIGYIALTGVHQINALVHNPNSVYRLAVVRKRKPQNVLPDINEINLSLADTQLIYGGLKRLYELVYKMKEIRLLAPVFPPTFTLSQLQEAYELVTDTTVFRTTFRRKAEDTAKSIEATGEIDASSPRNAELFRFIAG